MCLPFKIKAVTTNTNIYASPIVNVKLNIIMEHIKESLKRYVENKIPTGGFLEAVLSNDLVGAIGRADSENISRLPEIVRYIYNALPSNCWGSREKVEQWLNS